MYKFHSTEQKNFENMREVDNEWATKFHTDMISVKKQKSLRLKEAKN